MSYASNRLFGDNWSPAFFGALTSVGALFVLTEELIIKEKKKMEFKEKLVAIGKIFLLTIVPQFIMVASIGSVAYWGYMIEHISVIPMLFAVAGSIALLFLYLCAGVFIDNYMPSVFGLIGVFKNGFVGAARGVEVIFRKGRTSTLTGETHYHVETRKAPGGGAFIIGAIKALLLCIFAPIRFIIESVVVIFSDDRQYEWEDAFDSFLSAMNWEDMKVPAISLLVIIAGWLVVGPNLLIVNNKYNPDNIEITASEIKDLKYDYSQGIEFTVDLSIKNNGKGPIEHIEAYFYIKNKNGDVVYKTTETLKVLFCDPDYNISQDIYGEDQYLEGDKEWVYDWPIFIDADEYDISEFIDIEATDVEIYYDLREVRYKDNHFFHYESEEEAVRIEAATN